MGAHLHHGGGVRSVVDQAHLGCRHRGRPRPGRPGAAVEPVLHVQPALQHPAQVRRHQGGVGRVAELGLHVEHGHGGGPDRGRVGAAHRQPVRGQHARGAPQQAGPVGRDHGHLGAAHGRGRAALGGQRQLVLAQRRGLRHRVAVQHRLHPPHQVRDQGRLPVVPGGGPGRQPVRHGQGVQQLEQGAAAHRGGDLLHRHRVVQIAPGRDHRQQQVQPDRRGDELHVRGGQPHPAHDVPRHHLAGDTVVPRPALAHVV